MRHDPLVILDFETTGLDPDGGDRLTEVGLVRIEDGRVSERYHSLVNCGVRIPSYITGYTGITQAMVDGAPPIEQVMREFISFVRDDAVVSHGARFDERFYERECMALGIAAEHSPFICSMQLARRLHPDLPCHALGALAFKLKLPTSGLAHRAPADAEVTAELMLRLCRDIHDRQPGKVDADLLRRLMHSPLDAAFATSEPRPVPLCA